MLRAHKGEIPFFYWLMPFTAGIVCGIYYGVDQLLTFITATGIVSVTGFTILNLLYNRYNIHRYAWMGGLILNVFLLCAGWLLSYWHNDRNQDNYFAKHKAGYLVVQVSSEPKQKGIYTRFTAEVRQVIANQKHQATFGKILVTLTADSNAHLVNYGDVLVIPGSCKPIDPPFNPAEFNYKQYLAHQNIYYQSFLNRQQCRLVNYDAGNSILAFSLQLRQRLVNSIKQYLHTPEAAAIASTLLLGYKADLSPEVLQAYSQTGTIHILSVSGAHVAVIFLIISFLLKPFRHHRYGKMLNALLLLCILWGYTILTGLSPAAVRAAVMLSMVIISNAGTRPVHPLNVMAVSAMAMLLYNPFLITDVGFQLSYLAVFGLIAVQPIIAELWEPKHKWTNKLWQLCSFSLAAQLVTFPLSVYYFHQFPVYFLISNLLIILPAEAIVIVGITFLTSTFIPALAPFTKVAAYILEWLIIGLNKVLSYIEHWPYASLGRIWFNSWEHLLLYAIIFSLIYFVIYKKGKQLITTLACILILCTSLSWKAIRKQSTGHIIFFNVKKNTAILFRHNDKAVLLTDLLPNEKNYQYSVQPCLDSLGIESLQLCKLQHNLKNTFFSKHLNYIQFENKTVILFNPSIQNTVLPHKIGVDYLFYTRNPHSNLTFIRNNYNFKHFIVDAGVSAKRTQLLKHEADSLHINIIGLRRNKSYIVASNH
ncbi:ComEC/Rec2 family competence protein [Mucilaginibacter terrae]|uniref:Competence protein ComEC n=1 Tax=Mucilaginibacter terrae TaxID=1955052 RepID=A0ABU3GYX9_9SPHI|nr:ComEC/Rec2 family competence protein [Mucilaginibacter terrae]MDT3404967.1 competence protein ComEC [Mucilaginibacter terrae]